MTLNARQAQFVREYVIDHNGTQAAIRAGYSPGSAKVTASRLLTNANVCAAVADLERQAAEKYEVTVESLAKELDLAYKAAAKFKQAGPMVSAVTTKARLYGMITDKKQVSGDPDNPLTLSIASIMERIDGNSRGLPRKPVDRPVERPLLEAKQPVHDHRQGGERDALSDERRTDETLQ